ncbi:MAG: sugar transferase [Desulfovibrio sp.]|nr:sugar transferase [Desulfovibrio sp.]
MRKKLLTKSSKRIKRVLDLLLCLLCAPVAAPLCAGLALWIRADSAGPAIYRQERIGEGGKKFKIYKFRTMVADADARLSSCLAADPALAEEWARNRKLKKDPRLTRAGVFLRKTSLDELPQILNIFLGRMSFVGPRPIVAGEIRRYGRRFADYCGAKPGLTGLWQVTGRNNSTYRRRIACDAFYIKNWSALLDLKILLRTLPVALSGYGAY